MIHAFLFSYTYIYIYVILVILLFTNLENLALSRFQDFFVNNMRIT